MLPGTRPRRSVRRGRVVRNDIGTHRRHICRRTGEPGTIGGQAIRSAVHGTRVIEPGQLVAALFQPLRQRVQRIVDRRFNRAHYDAERALTDLGARLREEVDPDVIAGDIRAARSPRSSR